jgi:tRNA A-37 threonylcarbamoyl transferase component Bud32
MVSLLEGQTLGKYRVLEALGRGGMARVYRAYHPQLERYVAIKVLRSDLVEDEEFLARFQREARAVAGLRHAHIVQVFDFDTQDDIYYMVMELLEGDTLKARLNDYRSRGERMPFGEVVRVLLDVLDALAYAHSEGMVHRDIKPANILLTRRGQAVVTDFGIAHIVGGTQHTAAGALMGTLNYIAPEQGLEGHSDARSDIYTVGIVFYEMLTGRTPFDADTPLAVLMKHLQDPLPLPRRIDPGIPVSFERVVLKALAKRPEDRYQSAEEMAGALRQAASEAKVELPARISLPLSFTTAEAPSEAVAVLSGTARQKIPDAAFADGDTDPTLGERLKDETGARQPGHTGKTEGRAEGVGQELVAAASALTRVVASKTAHALREAIEAVESGPPEKEVKASTSPDAGPVPGQGGGAPDQTTSQILDRPGSFSKNLPGPPTARASGRVARLKASGVGRPILIGIALLTVVNLAGAWLVGLTGWNVYARGWPIELLLVGLGLCIIMSTTGSIWMLIPVGIILGNGLLFSYYSLTGNWWQWSFLWPTEPLLVIGAVLLGIWLAGRGEFSRRLSRSLAWLLGLVAAAWSVILALLALVMSWIG